MKAMLLSVAMVIAATGCETAQQKIAKGYIQDPGGYWVRADRPYFGDGKPWAAPGQAAFDPTVFNQAMAQNSGANAPQPVVIMGPNSPALTTISSPGGTTMISGIGGGPPIGAPVYRPPAYGYYGY